jgi:hypothetical protein
MVKRRYLLHELVTDTGMALAILEAKTRVTAAAGTVDLKKTIFTYEEEWGSLKGGENKKKWKGKQSRRESFEVIKIKLNGQRMGQSWVSRGNV